MESNSAALIIPRSKFEVIISKDVGGDKFQERHVPATDFVIRRYNLLPVTPMILVFLKKSVQRSIKMHTFALF